MANESTTPGVVSSVPISPGTGTTFALPAASAAVAQLWLTVFQPTTATAVAAIPPRTRRRDGSAAVPASVLWVLLI
ncbi:hypothetical protein [Streptomyces manipurensis]|uniref:hypothetical protein n=1 Tax=Streptomyces manipurensis TaxID=1077945 RepID=UPI003C70201A